MAKRVLVVDDEQSTRKYLSVVLREGGYDPVTACDGKDGMEKIKQSRPDLIILDVMMPKRSGLVLFKQLKKDDQYKEIPILMLTGASGVIEEMKAHEDETFESPYDNLRNAFRKAIQELRQDGLIKPEIFVDKPVDPQVLLDKVRTLLAPP